MNKSDLKDGMYVKLRDGSLRECYKGYFIGIKRVELELVHIEFYNNDLTHENTDKFDIVKVFNENNNTIWEREKEIDWSKVPVGTKVLVTDTGGELWNEAIFVDESEEGKFITYDRYNHMQEYWNYCKLAEGPKEEVTEDEIYEKYDKCVYSGECNKDGLLKSLGQFVLENYNVTRKDK